MERIYSIITGTGSHIPPVHVTNEAFINHRFFESDGSPINRSNHEVIGKFQDITTIVARKYVSDELNTSDIAALAALDALESSGTDPESFDYLIVAHNFGDTQAANKRPDYVPCLAARVKHKLGIKNPNTVA